MRNKTISVFISIINASDKLNKKEKEILISRISGETLETVGKRFRVTAERIRQKENIAVEKFMKKIYQLILFNKLE